MLGSHDWEYLHTALDTPCQLSLLTLSTIYNSTSTPLLRIQQFLRFILKYLDISTLLMVPRENILYVN